MRIKRIYVWALGLSRLSCCRLHVGVLQVRTCSSHEQTRSPPPTNPHPAKQTTGAEAVKKRTLAALHHAGELGRQWSQKSAQTATTTVNQWWGRYEEFVGLNEVRDAQHKVTEAEANFMVARGIVRESHVSLEALQVRLKEVRDRLDRVSREEAHYLELATMEHKLLQEERRLRTAYENAEGSEREKFALFSAAVRESHEKERTRAERTKNWSIIGSVLGALIGVMGSTYINRVRLQELKNLLLEAQKGPESLQEALRVQAGNHRSQQDELRLLIDSLRTALADAFTQSGVADMNKPKVKAAAPAADRRVQALLESLPLQLEQLERGVGRVEGQLSTVRGILESRAQTETQSSAQAAQPLLGVSDREVKSPQGTQGTLGEGIRTNTSYNAFFTYTASAITISALYLLLRGAN